MGERDHPPFAPVHGLELHRHVEDLPDRVVIEALGVAHDLARGRVAEARDAVGPLRIPGEVRRLGDRDVEEEATAGLEMLADALQEGLHVRPGVQVQEGVEGAEHQRETTPQAHLPHVALDQLDAASPGLPLRAPEGPPQVVEHGTRPVHADHLGAGLGHLDGEAPVADAVLEERAPVRRGQRPVKIRVVAALGVALRVVGRVVVVRP